MRISDWSSDVCSSDLSTRRSGHRRPEAHMTLEVYGHPFSAYCQKVFIALYENATPFDFRTIDPDHPENAVEWARLWPLKRFPLLVDNGRPVMEATVIDRKSVV